MGCDIHLYREKKVDDKWQSADEWERPSWAEGDDELHIKFDKLAYIGRNYELFGALSKGVRRDVSFAFEPRGVPFNMSPEVSQSFESWDSDGHSHSYLYLHELREFADFLNTQTICIEGMKDVKQLAELRASIASGNPDWDKLFPYCAATNSPGHVDFEMDVPASYYIGRELKQIIDSFNGIDGENHRIVFWFDN